MQVDGTTRGVERTLYCGSMARRGSDRILLSCRLARGRSMRATRDWRGWAVAAEMNHRTRRTERRPAAVEQHAPMFVECRMDVCVDASDAEQPYYYLSKNRKKM